MNANTQVQREMHPGLVNEQFEKIIDIGQAHGCLGVKVNGAGGDGGSITLLTNGDMPKKRRLEVELTAEKFTVIPIYLARRGLRVCITE